MKIQYFYLILVYSFFSSLDIDTKNDVRPFFAWMTFDEIAKKIIVKIEEYKKIKQSILALENNDLIAKRLQEEELIMIDEQIKELQSTADFIAESYKELKEVRRKHLQFP